MRVRHLATGATLALLCSVLIGGTTAARSDRQTTAVMWHPQTGLTGPVGSGAAAQLVRRDGGLSFEMSTAQLRPGHAYTVWFVVINNPQACAASPCSGPDILQNPDTASQVTYGAGHISGKGGRGGFGGSFQVGSLDGWLPDAELSAPRTAEIQLVLNDHGPVLKGYLPEMIQTYRTGCTDASIPGIFPPSARADGTPGPNACQLYQVAVFAGS
jgi:hypothetical protein